MTDPPPSRPKHLLDVGAVAERLNVAPKTVRRKIERGELPVVRIGKLIRVTEEDLEAYVASRRSAVRA